MQRDEEIVHICEDEKFIDTAYEIYENTFPGRNCFVILHSSSTDEVEYLSKKNNYKFVSITDEIISKVNSYTKNARVVVFHSLSTLNAKIILECDFGKAIRVCHLFGYEIYNNSLIKHENIYGKITREIIGKCNKKKRFNYKLKTKLKNFIRRLIGKKSIVPKGAESDKIVLRALKNIDLIGGPAVESFQMYRDKSLITDITDYFKFSYYPIDKIIKKGYDKINSNNILLGNSATASNNHLEAFEILEKLEIKDRKIVVPLSYGKDDYAQEMIIKGNELFGENFHSLSKFMPRDEYHRLMQGCGITIMNHYRQQAAGNIIAALYMGSKVYLSEKNILFQYLKRLGCYVYSIEENLITDINNGLRLLSPTKAEINRKILLEDLSINKIKTELEKAIKLRLNSN